MDSSGRGNGAPPTPEDILRAPLLSGSGDHTDSSYVRVGSAASTSSQLTSDTRVGRSESRKSEHSESGRRSKSRKLRPVTSKAKIGRESPVISTRPPLSVSMQQLGGRSGPGSPQWASRMSPRNGMAAGSPSPLSVNRGGGTGTGLYSEVDETSSSISQKSEVATGTRLSCLTRPAPVACSSDPQQCSF